MSNQLFYRGPMSPTKKIEAVISEIEQLKSQTEQIADELAQKAVRQMLEQTEDIVNQLLEKAEGTIGEAGNEATDLAKKSAKKAAKKAAKRAARKQSKKAAKKAAKKYSKKALKRISISTESELNSAVAEEPAVVENLETEQTIETDKDS
ncbi:hypothetical protein ACFFHM_03500 [Halalkalibacter kiskunsagensis]|uniref:Uncharacterized protein n=1 Tax=Halalkalibacter kiskunsagensis TaxID=1548599 RepID=A0ABV6K8H8_9BACI